MNIYLVGGAVRDELLSLPVTEKDWVVVGATPEELLAKGFKPVGKDFPVFLHPDTHEEYALARTERKSGHGYTGFKFHAAPGVTLEEDLIRRDLTINAIAKNEAGDLIDPYNGQKDLSNRILRHVSPAFVEDPLRVLRIARFAARFHGLGFTIAPETHALLKTICDSGELETLTPNRVWMEWEKTLKGQNPEIFFQVLLHCGALSTWLPDFSPQNDRQARAFNALKLSAELTDSPEIRFAAFCFELNLSDLEARLPLPRSFTGVAKLTHKNWGSVDQALNLTAKELLTLLEQCDALRRPDRFHQFLESCRAILESQSVERSKIQQKQVVRPLPQIAHLQAALSSIQGVTPQSVIHPGMKGPEIAEALQKSRLKTLQKDLKIH